MLQVALLVVASSSLVVFVAAVIARAAKRRAAGLTERTIGRESERRYLVEHWAEVERVARETMTAEEVDSVRRRVFGLE